MKNRQLTFVISEFDKARKQNRKPSLINILNKLFDKKSKNEK